MPMLYEKQTNRRKGIIRTEPTPKTIDNNKDLLTNIGIIKMELTLRQQTKKWDVCFWLGYTKDINFTIDWDSGFTFKVSNSVNSNAKMYMKIN